MTALLKYLGKYARFHLLLVVTSFTICTIFTWPFVANLKNFYYDRGDYQVSGSILAYNEYSIRTGKIFNRQEYINGYQFYPQPYTLAYSDLRLTPSLLYAPVYWLTQDLVYSVNMVAFLSFVLSFLSSFYAIRYFIHNFSSEARHYIRYNTLASVVGAAIYTFNPLAAARFPEHFELLNKFFLPLVFLFTYKYLKAPTLKNAFIFSLVFTLNAFSAIYFQIFTLLLLPLFALPFLLSRIRKRDGYYFVRLIKTSLISIVFLPLFLYFNISYVEFSEKEMTTRSLQANSFFSARIIDYISSTKRSLLYGRFTESLDQFRAPKDENGNFNYLEHTLFFNLTPSLFFLLSLIFLLKTHKERGIQDPLIIFSLCVLGFTTFILTLGPFFQGWNGNSGTFKLPFYYLYHWLPLLKAIRAPTRFLFIFYVPFSIFVSLGVFWVFTTLVKFLKNRNTLSAVTIFLFLVIMAGTYLENFYIDGPLVSYKEKSYILPKLQFDYSQNNALGFLEGKNTVHFPVYYPEPGLDSIYLNWAARTHEKIVNGNSGYIPTDQAALLLSLNGEINDEEIKKLVSIGVDYAIVHKDLPGFKSDNYRKFDEDFSQYLVFDDNNISVFSLSNVQVNKCASTDLEIRLSTAVVTGTNRQTPILFLKNKNDCYLGSIYTQRYKEEFFYSAGVFGNPIERSVRFKIPIVIGPYQEVVLSEINNELRVQ